MPAGKVAGSLLRRIVSAEAFSIENRPPIAFAMLNKKTAHFSLENVFFHLAHTPPMPRKNDPWKRIT